MLKRKKKKLIETPNGEVITDKELERLRKIEGKYYDLKREVNSLLVDINMEGPIEITISKKTLKGMVAKSLRGTKYNLLSGKVSSMPVSDRLKDRIVDDLFDYLEDVPLKDNLDRLAVNIVLKGGDELG
ncbi:MAG: hypothetical protein IJV71_03495 [Lachnospiraceae bacterium]|nr:hypothetical protein [Lachnospiraceae bacterium]